MELKRGIVIVAIIFLLLTILTTIISLLSIINEDLTFTITPTHKSLVVYQGENATIPFSIQSKFTGICFSICEGKFLDLSKGDVILEENFTIYPFEIKKINGTLGAPEIGIGQKSYNLNLKCRNLKTPLCITQGQWTERTAYITLNYQFNPEKGYIQEMAKNNLTTVLLSLNRTDYNMQETLDLLNQIENKTVVENEISTQIFLNGINFNSSNNEAIYLRKIWYEQEGYDLILQRLTEDFFDKILSLENYSEKSMFSLYALLRTHSQLIDSIKSEERILNILDFSNLSSYEKENFLVDYERFRSLNFSSYGEFNNSFVLSKENLDSSFLSYAQNASFEINTQKNLRCLIKNYCSVEDNSQDISLNYTDICASLSKEEYETKKADNKFAYDYAIQNNLNLSGLNEDNSYDLVYAYLNISDYLNNKRFVQETEILYSNSLRKSANSEIQKQNEEILKLNEKISNLNSLIEVLNVMILQNGSEDLSLCSNLIMNYNNERENFKKENLAIGLLSICYAKIDMAVNGTFGEHNETLPSVSKIESLAEEKIENQPYSFPLEFEIMAINLTDHYRISLESPFQKICSVPENYSKISININPIIIQPFNSFNQTINISLEKPMPTCCIFGKCNLCCTNLSCSDDPNTFPIIFLHGHPFNEENSPDYSLDIFNELQGKLISDGYLNAGIVTSTSSYSEIPRGDWGFSGMPVTIKASYYYNVSNTTGIALTDITKTNENITIYADRLKEIIDLIKYRTGKNKVNLIAHSMGGLVSREYIMKYGEESVDNFIMIGTPNYGISGDIDNYCPLLGARIECQEMQQNSSFLQKLNSYLPQNKTKYYTITGSGCDTNSFDGDGVVNTNNVPLSYGTNYYINGSCPNLFSLLHVSILDLQKYPQTYITIKEILKTP